MAAGRFDGEGGIGAVPGDVGGGAVGGEDGLIPEALVDGKLGTVVGGVQDAPPEDPDALAFDVEEGDVGVPPGSGLAGEMSQARAGEFDETGRVGRGVLFGRKNFGRGRFRRTEEFAEEAAFGEELVAEDLLHGAGFGVRAVGEGFGREGEPDGAGFVGLAGVGIEQVLVDGIGGSGNLRIGESGLRILHELTVRYARSP